MKITGAHLARAGSIWAGTLEALNGFLDGIPIQQQKMMETPVGSDFSELPEILQIVNGDTAIVNIHGTLVTKRQWYDSLIGRVSYSAIREAVMYSLTDSNIKRILLMVDSGGGQVNGVSDLAAFLTKAAKIKPMITHTTGNLCSAAYWLGSCASTITASDTATIGSIGAMLIHSEYTEMMKEAGINVTVVRSGPYKYLGNQFEKLSEDALAELQGDINSAEAIFVKRIAANRNKGEDYVRQQMGKGRTFIAQTAKDVGLVDAVYSYDDMMSKVLSGAFDNINNRVENTILGSVNMQTEEQRQAALQAMAEQGITIDDTQGTAAKTEPVEPTTADTAQPDTTATTVEGEGAEGDTQDTTQASVETIVKPESEYTQKLEAKLTEKDETIINLKVEAQAMAKQIQALQAAVEPMKEIVARSAKNMAIGLGQTGADFSSLDAQALIAQHSQLATSFQEKYKAGGVSAAQAKVHTPTPQQMSAYHIAATKSTKLA